MRNQSIGEHAVIDAATGDSEPLRRLARGPLLSSLHRGEWSPDGQSLTMAGNHERFPCRHGH